MIVKTINLTKTYFKTKVLDNVSVNIPKNSITGIIGPNGAGKSTLIKIISGFEFPDTGEVYIDEQKTDNFNQRKKYISYMPEKMSLYPDYFTEEFLNYFHKIINYKDKKLFEKLSLKSILTKKIKHLSKGWHQRLKLYTALTNRKPILILDEPFDGFDPLQMMEIIDIFKTQNLFGRSFILSIHQLSDAQKICNYFILLDGGKKIAEGSIKQLLELTECKSDNLEKIFLKLIGK